MKKTLRIACACLIVFLLLGATVTASANNNSNDTASHAQSVWDGIISYKLHSVGESDVQSLIDGYFCANAGISGEWYIFALSRMGGYDFSSYESALLTYLKDHRISSPASKLKYALCLYSAGSTDPYIDSIIAEAVSSSAIMPLIYSLHLINNGYSIGAVSSDDVIDQILSLQCPDDGWAVSGQQGDVDVTAMAIQSLSPHYDSNGSVKDAIDGALTLLSSRQADNGGFSSYGVQNPESAAQVMIALCSLGIDCTQDERFIKQNTTLFDVIERYKLADGSFCHTDGGKTNEIATAQVLCAMTAYIRMSEGSSPLYILDSEKIENSGTVESGSETGDKEQNTLPPNTSGGSEGSFPLFKIIVCSAVAFLGALACVCLFIFKRRHTKNFIAVIVAVALIIGFVALSDIQSAESYYNGEAVTKTDAIGKITMTIRCDTVLDKLDGEHIPKDGVILPPVSMDIRDGDTVYVLLCEAARQHNIQLENNGTADMAYIAGINYIYEFDCGDLSGWTFRVNGKVPDVGCSEYTLHDGDHIEWLYTCDLGDDLE